MMIELYNLVARVVTHFLNNVRRLFELPGKLSKLSDV